MSIPNRPNLADLLHMPVGAVVAIPSDNLALLQDEADEALRFAKLTKDWIDGALAVKYAEAVSTVYATTLVSIASSASGRCLSPSA